MKTRRNAYNRETLPGFIVKDFIASFDATIVKISGRGGIGFVFREQEKGDHYSVVCRTDGSYGLYYYFAEKDEWSTIHSDIQNDIIQLENGITNYFSVAVKGSIFTIYANGLELATVEDESLLGEGRVGFALELYEAGQSMSVEFDDFFLMENP